MAKNYELDKNKLLKSLEIDTSCFESTEDFSMEKMGLAKSILSLADIDQDRLGPGVNYSRGGRHKGVGRYDYLVPGPDACGPQRQVQGIEAAV